jgi:hypothetical protein
MFAQSEPRFLPGLSLFCPHSQKRCILSPLFAALTHSASRKFFSCHSLAQSEAEGYENTRDGYGIFPSKLEAEPGIFPRNISAFQRSDLLTLLESALPQNAPVTLLESALPKTLDLKFFRIRTYEKRGEGVRSVN